MYQRIMIPLDGSQVAECVLPHAEAFIKNGLVETAVLIRVLESMPIPMFESGVNVEYMEKALQNNEKEAREYLQKIADGFSQHGVSIKCEVLEGPIADTLASYAEDNKVDLILVATHGRSGIGRWVMGSVADRILRSSHVPVFMVNAGSSSE